MEINLGDEQIIELQAAFSSDQIQEKALAKRVDAFGQMAKLIQRPKPEDIEIVSTQKRYEPFWYAVATARYVYDRRHTYSVEVAPEVQTATIYDHEHTVANEHGRAFALDAIEHCVEEIHREVTLDAQRGNETDVAKYMTFPQNAVTDIAALEQGGALVVAPEVRGSFVVRKLISSLMKTFQADKIREEKIDVERVALFYRAIYAVEYLWKSKQKKQVVEFDALTGEMKAESGEIKKHMVRVLENDALFDIGADALGTVFPGVNVAVKLGRLGLRKVVK